MGAPATISVSLFQKTDPISGFRNGSPITRRVTGSSLALILDAGASSEANTDQGESHDFDACGERVFRGGARRLGDATKLRRLTAYEVLSQLIAKSEVRFQGLGLLFDGVS